MNLIVKIFNWITLMIFISACVNKSEINNSQEIINIGDNINNTKTINLSQIVSNIYYLPLENNKEIYIPYIDDCKFFKDYLVVTNLGQCLIFNTQGKFIKQIGVRGRGPGEYQFVTTAAVDNDSNIYIQSLYDLYEYKFRGSLKGKSKNLFMFNNNPNEYLTNWILVNDTLFFGHLPNSTGSVANKAILMNKKSQVLRLYKNFVLFERKRAVGSGLEELANIYHFGKVIYYKDFYNDTLFYLDAKYDLIPKYIFKFGNFKEPISERAKIPGQGSSISKYVHVLNVFQTSRFLLIDCQFGDNFPVKRITPKIVTLPSGKTITIQTNTTRALGIYYKHTGKVIFCKPTSTDNPLFTSGIYNDIDAGPRFFPFKQVNDSTLVMWLNTKDLINHINSADFKNNIPKHEEKKKELEKLGKKLTDFDNPILMFVTFKK